jgi:hypothetical protein
MEEGTYRRKWGEHLNRERGDINREWGMES